METSREDLLLTPQFFSPSTFTTTNISCSAPHFSFPLQHCSTICVAAHKYHPLHNHHTNISLRSHIPHSPTPSTLHTTSHLRFKKKYECPQETRLRNNLNITVHSYFVTPACITPTTLHIVNSAATYVQSFSYMSTSYSPPVTYVYTGPSPAWMQPIHPPPLLLRTPPANLQLLLSRGSRNLL